MDSGLDDLPKILAMAEHDPPEQSATDGEIVLDQLFPFPLDDFQLEAIDALNQGQSVVVSAPTGSGKTLIGEYAIHRAIAHGQKVFYTTPLKALSNQKLRDFREQFGACLLYTSPSPRDQRGSRMPSSA